MWHDQKSHASKQGAYAIGREKPKTSFKPVVNFMKHLTHSPTDLNTPILKQVLYLLKNSLERGKKVGEKQVPWVESYFGKISHSRKY